MNIRGHFSKVAEHYDALSPNGLYATLAPHDKGGRKSEYVNAVFDAAVLGELPERSDSKILDIGCGTGALTRLLGDRFGQAWGVDVSPRMLESARKHCQPTTNIGLALVDGVHLPFESDAFEFAVARESLCYIPEPLLGTILSEIHRILSPGGRFLWLEQVSNSPHWQHHPSSPKLVKRPIRDLETALATAGFRLRSSRVVRTPRFPWVYPIWLGLVPRRLTVRLAAIEVAWHKWFGGLSRRWWNQLLVAEKSK